jgi:hypothetical protein
MKWHPLVASVAFAGTVLGGAPAFAQEAPAAPAPARADAPVRVHLRTLRPKDSARMFIRRPDGSYAFVCNSPCTADMAAHSELRVVLGDNDDEPHAFVLPADLGSELDLEVRAGGVGSLVGSIVLMGTGGALAISGLTFIALSGISVNNSTTSSTRDTYKTVGFVFIGLGVAAAAGGLVWLLSRSREPRVQGAPYAGPVAYDRHQTVIGDVALQKPREPTTALAPLSAPLELSFGF